MNTATHFLSSLVAGALIASASAQTPPAGTGGFGRGALPADQPMPRTDANSRLAHEQLLEKAKKGGIDIYFVGDSITRRWGTSDAMYAKYFANWNSNFFGWNAADFGWGGDSVQHILWRLENGELDGVNPKVIVFLGGINNINPRMNDDQIAGVERGIKKCLDLCQEKAPKATIILTAIFPGKNAITVINKINEDIAKFADGNKIRFLNVNDKLADKDGHPYPGMFNSDNLHPDTAGYQVWADGLKPIFTELLGQPAKTDHAPPPTGDPSAPTPTPASGAPPAK